MTRPRRRQPIDQRTATQSQTAAYTYLCHGAVAPGSPVDLPLFGEGWRGFVNASSLALMSPQSFTDKVMWTDDIRSVAAMPHLFA
jgi:hypothetical protein